MAKKPAKSSEQVEKFKSTIGRMVKINIWIDQKFQFLSDDAQLVWFHVYTNPQSNGLGIFHATIEGLAAAKKWPLERYRKGFRECLDNGLFLYDETFHTIYFPNFLKHNKPANPNVMKGLLQSWDYIPQSEYKINVYQQLARISETFKRELETLRLTLPQTYGQTLGQTIPETGTVIGTGTGTGNKPLPQPPEELSTGYLRKDEEIDPETGEVIQFAGGAK